MADRDVKFHLVGLESLVHDSESGMTNARRIILVLGSNTHIRLCGSYDIDEIYPLVRKESEDAFENVKPLLYQAADDESAIRQMIDLSSDFRSITYNPIISALSYLELARFYFDKQMSSSDISLQFNRIKRIMQSKEIPDMSSVSAEDTPIYHALISYSASFSCFPELNPVRTLYLRFFDKDTYRSLDFWSRVKEKYMPLFIERAPNVMRIAPIGQ